ncbi:MAG TPA: autotransporter domain-containing protein [bacterium]
MRRLALLALVGMLLPLAVWGQVAAPSLVPASPGVADPTLTKDPTLVPTNPATLGWPQATRLAAGIVRADRQQPSSNIKDGAGDTIVKNPAISTQYEGSYAGGVYRGERYGIAAETLTIRDTGSPDAPLDDFRHNAAFGYALSDRFAVGTGASFDSDRQDNNHKRTTGISAGASMRLGERWYVGGVVGHESSEQHAINASGSDGNATSTILVAGVGYVTEGSLRMHIEAAAGTIQITGDSQQAVSAQLQTVSVEALYKSWVFGLGFLAAHGSFKADAGANDLTWTSGEATVGVVPEHGFGVLYHYGFGAARAKLTFDPFTSQVDTLAKTHSLTVVWQY